MTPLLLLAAASVVLCAGELIGARYRWLAYRRRHDSFRTFQAHFRRADVHVDVLVAVQEYFGQVTAVRNFPMRPSDNLAELYALQHEDVQDAVVVIAGTADFLSPAVLDAAEWTSVRTVEDLVYTAHRLHCAARRRDRSTRDRAAAARGRPAAARPSVAPPRGLR